MALADLAHAAARKGDRETAQQYFRRAFELESQAAQTISSNIGAQPTRAVLFRSAATLALQCGLIEETISLIQEGLAGDPPAAIAEELRSLIEDVEGRKFSASADLAIELTNFFKKNEWTINHNVHLPGRDAKFFDVSELQIASHASRYIRSQFPLGIYRHQLAALKEFVNGSNICLSTGTSSGKSMVFYAGIIHQLEMRPNSRVLLIYPLKALGREQEGKLKDAFKSAGMNISLGRLDGQVPVRNRLNILRRSQVLIMTPDLIHAWLLTSLAEQGVKEFLKKLELVIVDEVHSYTGVFGSNSAFLYRRLRHLLGILGEKCTFMCASATMANPSDHLEKLFGAKFHIIGPDNDSSPRHSTDIILVTPSQSQDLLSGVTELFRHLGSSKNRRFIAFVDSRKQVEYLASIMRRTDEEPESRTVWDDHLEKMQILPFRAGYELEDRNAIQDRLSSGKMRGVVSTSALELGIDVPYLDTGVLLGVPASSTSFLQRIGRIGRHKPGMVIVINRGDLQDQQAFKNADKLMSRPLTESSLYLENRRIQYLNALCIARHGGEQDSLLGVEAGTEVDFASPIGWPPGFVDLCKKERIGEIPSDLQSMKIEGGENPNHIFPLRDVERQFQVELKQGPEQRSLGGLSHSQVMREAYPGAVYYYTGRPFRVYRVFQLDKKIQVRPESQYITKPIALPTLVFPNLSPGNVYRSLRLGSMSIIESNLQIRETITGYKERRGPNEITFQYPLKNGIAFDLQRFTRNYFTTGIVFTHPAFSSSGVHSDVCAQLIYEAFISLIPFERQDLGVAFDRHRTDKGVIKRGDVFIALHDQTYGSLRLSSRVLEDDLLIKLLGRTEELLETSDLRNSDPITAEALQLFSSEAKEKPEPFAFDDTRRAMVTQVGEVFSVIMPGSKALNIRRNNEEFEVQRVFFSPALNGIAYAGRHFGTGTKEGIEIVPLDFLAPIPGESRLGYYDAETGTAEELLPD